MSDLPAFSAHICLYIENSASEVEEALRSAFDEQTHPPSELVAVFDGPVPDAVEAVVQEFAKRHPCIFERFEQNKGHGAARSAAIARTNFAWSAVVDSDDISMPDRFEQLCRVAADNPQYAVIAGGLTEFYEEGGQRHLLSYRHYPETSSQIRDFARSRSPIAQPTALLNVEAIHSVGGYQSWYNNEDYYLWLRLLKAGYEMYNLPQSLLLFRTQPALYGRRGGLRYWWHEVRLQWFSLHQSTTTIGHFLFGTGARFFIQVLTPEALRGAIYRKLLRKS